MKSPVDALWDVLAETGKAIGDGFTIAAEILCPRDHTVEDRLRSWESAAVAVEDEICDEADACESEVRQCACGAGYATAAECPWCREVGECICWVGHGDCGGCSGVPGISHEPACGWDWNPECPQHGEGLKASAAVSAAVDGAADRKAASPTPSGVEGPGGASDIPQSAPPGQPRGEDPNRLMGRYTRLMAEQTSPVPLVVAGESPRGVSTDQPSLGEPICDNLADLLHRAADVLFASDAHCPALIAELRTRADRFAAVESVIGYGRGTAGE